MIINDILSEIWKIHLSEALTGSSNFEDSYTLRILKEIANPYAAGGNWLVWPKQNDAKNLKTTETLAHGTHLRVLSETYPMNTNMTGFRLLTKIFASFCFGRK